MRIWPNLKKKAGGEHIYLYTTIQTVNIHTTSLTFKVGFRGLQPHHALNKPRVHLRLIGAFPRSCAQGAP